MPTQIFKTLIMLSFLSGSVLFDFNKDTDLSSWRVVDDVVMGGKSTGNFVLNKDGHAVFYGYVSLENYGGFSSVRTRFKTKEIGNHTKVVFRLKGDGKDYQFRIKSSSRDYFSYIKPFETSGEWQEIEIPLASLYPSFRGRILDLPNFDAKSFEEIAFLIANKKEEKFKLILDKIYLK